MQLILNVQSKRATELLRKVSERYSEISVERVRAKTALIEALEAESARRKALPWYSRMWLSTETEEIHMQWAGLDAGTDIPYTESAGISVSNRNYLAGRAFSDWAPIYSKLAGCVGSSGNIVLEDAEVSFLTLKGLL